MLRTPCFVLVLSAATGLCASIARAQTSTNEPAADAGSPGEITVTATRTPRRVDDIPASVTVLRQHDIEAAGARDIKAAFENEIDVTIRAAPARFSSALSSTGRAGNEGINIRGLEGNQVLIVVDGIRVPNAFSFGPFSTGRGDYLSVDTAQAIDVLRGPASVQFGSDGLAGAVSVRTIEPVDLLRGRDFGGFVRLGYASVDRGVTATAAIAGRSEGWQGLLMLSSRKGHETANRGTVDTEDASRTTPNPLDTTTTSVLAKLRNDLSAAHQIGVTIEALRRDQDTEVFTARVPESPFAQGTLDLDGHDRVKRERVSLEHRYADDAGGLVQSATTRLYTQRADVRQQTLEDRTVTDRTRDNLYRERVNGVSTVLTSRLGAADALWRQTLSYGLEASRTKVTGVRDGDPPPFGEVLPAKPFPDTEYTLAGAFVQSEIESDAFMLIPGLRLDHYKLAPSAAGYVGDVVTLTDTAVTPRLGLVWRLAPLAAPYAQISSGFRAPTPDQVNNSFTNLAFGYQSIGNPELKPERARSVELGLRGQAGGFSYSMAAYDNRYRDFISQEVVSGSGAPGDPLSFQYINLANAHIQGAEARGQWRLDAQWLATAGMAWSRGDSEQDGVKTPLDSIQPWRASFGLRYRLFDWELRSNLLHSAGKPADRIATTEPAPFAPKGYTVLDLGATWAISRQVSLIANINNVFDARYWRWSDVRGLAADSTVAEAYTAPGREAQVAVRVNF